MRVLGVDFGLRWIGLARSDPGGMLATPLRSLRIASVREAPVAIATERLGLTRGDLAALTRVLVNWLIMIAAVWIATAVVPGIVVNGGLGTYLAISLLFGLVNAVLGPVLYWLAGSQSWLRLGGSAVIVNGILFAATAGLSPNLDIGGLGGAVLGALVVAVASTLLELVFRPIPEGSNDAI